ncbi:MAG: HAMP domain-containing histidine kinase [Sphingomonas bacterium]|nr:HAMP domain-containing histidine kinase [Sphingomonas bacterium]
MSSWRASAAYRIGIAYSAAFALGVALLGFVAFWAIHVAFLRQLDAMITDEAQTLAAEFRHDGGGELADAIAQRQASRSPAKLMYAVYAPDGQRTIGSLHAARPALGLRDIAFIDPVEGPDEARGLAIDLAPGQRLLVAADREWIERTDRTVILIFAGGFAGICVLGLIGGLLFGAYLRRRLHAISASAEAIVGGRVGERMPVGPDGDEFDQLAMTLNHMLARIEGLLENIRQVSSDIAHDLRTPLSRLRNRLETGLAEAASSPAARAAIEDSIGQVDEVLRLFSAILRIAEVESGETRRFFADFDLSQLIDDLVEDYALAIREGGRDLASSIDPGLTMFGDRELVAQATANLLENVQRHTPQGSAIRVSVAGSMASISIEVADNGPGVPSSEWGRIVKRFKRLDSSRSTGGYGLGLNLVNAVARLHEGRLLFRDMVPGLAAIIELPRRAGLVAPDPDR